MPIPVAARSNTSVCGLSLAGTAGSNRAGEYRCLSLTNVVCCPVKISTTGRPLVQRSLTECDVSECDPETSTIMGPRSEFGCCATSKAKQSTTVICAYIMYRYCTILPTFEIFFSTAYVIKG